MRRRREQDAAAPSRRTRLSSRADTPPPEALEDGAPLALSGGLARLPWERVGETIVGFLAPPPELTVQGPKGVDMRTLQMQLAPLRFVCALWHRLIGSLVNEYETQVWSLDFPNKPSQRSNGPNAKPKAFQLQCTAQYPEKPSRPLMVPRSALPPDRLIRIQWHPVLSAFPAVVRLDLLNVCLSLIEKVLPAAAQHCPQVEFLILPLKQTSWSRGLMTHERLTTRLVAALRSWHASNEGLRGLCIPEWPSGPNGQYDELLAAVAAYCPRLEFLRGWYGENLSVPLTARRLGNVQPTVWEAFCSNCARLREFSWLLAPMSNAYVNQFRLTPKPWMKELFIDDTTFTPDPADIASCQSMFPALPGLTTLSLWMPNYGRLPTQRDQVSMGSLEALTSSVARNCPLLESFRCFFPRSLNPAALITGDALGELIGGHAIRNVEMSPVVLSSNTLVRMLQAIATRKKRRLCHVELNTVGSVHEAIGELLQYLRSEDKSILASARFRLAVSSPDGDQTEGRSLQRAGDVATRVKSIQHRLAGIITRLETTTHQLDGRSKRSLSGIELWINS